MLPRDGSLVPPDVGDHDEQGGPEHDRHHDVVEPEPVADVLLQAVVLSGMGEISKWRQLNDKIQYRVVRDLSFYEMRWSL